MPKRKTILISCLTIAMLASIFFGFKVNAATSPFNAANFQKLSLTIKELQLSNTSGQYKSGDTINGSFQLNNNTNFYSQDVYSEIAIHRQPLDAETAPVFSLDETTVYDRLRVTEPINFSPQEQKKINFSYKIPQYFPAGSNYYLQIIAFSSREEILAVDYLKITVNNAANVEKFILLDSQKGGVLTKDRLYSLQEGPVFNYGVEYKPVNLLNEKNQTSLKNQVKVNVFFKNTGGLVEKPKIKLISYRYGAPLKEISVSETEWSNNFIKDAVGSIVLTLPLFQEPGSYETFVQFFDAEEKISNPLGVRYITAGDSGLIYDFLVEKKDENNFILNVLLAGPADVATRNQAKDILAQVIFTVKEENTNKICLSKAFDVNLKNAGIVQTPFTLENCSSPYVFSAQLIKAGQSLDQQGITVKKSTTPTQSLIIFLAIIIVALIGIILVFKKLGKGKLPPLAGLLIFFFIVALSFLTGVASANATGVSGPIACSIYNCYTCASSLNSPACYSGVLNYTCSDCNALTCDKCCSPGEGGVRDIETNTCTYGYWGQCTEYGCAWISGSCHYQESLTSQQSWSVSWPRFKFNDANDSDSSSNRFVYIRSTSFGNWSALDYSISYTYDSAKNYFTVPAGTQSFGIGAIIHQAPNCNNGGLGGRGAITFYIVDQNGSLVKSFSDQGLWLKKYGEGNATYNFNLPISGLSEGKKYSLIIQDYKLFLGGQDTIDYQIFSYVTADFFYGNLPPPPVVPTCLMSASPNPCAIPAGGSTCTSNIQWTAANTDGVDIKIGGSTFASTGDGSHNQDAPWIVGNANAVFECVQRSTGTTLGSTTVRGVLPPPLSEPSCPTSPSFFASPSSIFSGQSSTLSWGSVPNAVNCSINQGVGTVSCSGGSKIISPSNTTTYTLTGTSTNNLSATCPTTVNVTTPVSCSLSISKNDICINSDTVIWAGGSTPSQGYKVLWYGTKDRVQDADGEDYDQLTNFTLTDGPFSNSYIGNYTRYIKLFDNNNNQVCTSTPVNVVIKDCGFSDLIPQDLAVSGELKPGSALTFSAKVKNQGATDASNSLARFCVDNSDCLNSTTGRLGSNYNVSSLAAGAVSNTITSPAWTATAGSHTLYFCADVGKAITESSEANNCDSKTFVTPAPGVTTVSGYVKDSSSVGINSVDVVADCACAAGPCPPSFSATTNSSGYYTITIPDNVAADTSRCVSASVSASKSSCTFSPNPASVAVVRGGNVTQDFSGSCGAVPILTYVIDPASASKQVGQTQQFTGWYDPDGPPSDNQQDKTSSATWTSSNTSVATISSGLAACVSAGGPITITSVYSGLTATASFTCSSLPTYLLTVTKAGTGSGTVISTPSGINCGTTCSASYTSGTSVTLAASASTGSTFTGWSEEGCSGTDTCAVSMTQARSVTATFNTVVDQAPVAVATISKDGANYANSITVTQGVPVTIYLSAGKPVPGSTDPNGWTDSTNGVSTDPGKCEWNADLDQLVEHSWQSRVDQTISHPISPSACDIDLGIKTFNDDLGGQSSKTITYEVLRIIDKPGAVSNIDTVSVIVQAPTLYALTVTKAGTGSGTVTSSPTGINCGSDCSENYTSGTSVALTASPAFGSTFTGWSGEGCSGISSCTVTMTQIRNVTATFNLVSCTATTWSPDSSTICSGTTFVQTSNCGTTRTSTGTKNCGSGDYCGNGYCGSSETCSNCPLDCHYPISCPYPPSTCTPGTSYSEWSTCSGDCHASSTQSRTVYNIYSDCSTSSTTESQACHVSCPPNCSFWAGLPDSTSKPNSISIILPNFTTLSWECFNTPDSCSINQDIGPVDTSGGPKQVRPSDTTIYTLNCNNSDGQWTGDVKVNVGFIPWIREILPR